MTTIVLDTHVVVWLLEGNDCLGSKARQTIEQGASDNCVKFSAITAWEIAMHVSKGHLAFDQDVEQWLASAVALPGLSVEPLSLPIAVQSTRLPGDLHADPADRIIVATTRHIGAVLITADQALLRYSGAGHLFTQNAEA